MIGALTKTKTKMKMKAKSKPGTPIEIHDMRYSKR